jgi:FixJ family two-component response regulator
MTQSDFTVFLVDDDPGVARGVSRMLEANGYGVRKFESARPFLEQQTTNARGCAVIDFSLPDLDGLALQAAMAERGLRHPVIFISGVGDVCVGVKAMKAGAVDFLTKPVRARDLLAAIARASAVEAELHDHCSEVSRINERVSRLTCREREVLTCVIAGLLNKQIAARLEITEKTVKLHRGRMMQKMGVRSVVDLVRMTETVGVKPSTDSRATVEDVPGHAAHLQAR